MARFGCAFKLSGTQTVPNPRFNFKLGHPGPAVHGVARRPRRSLMPCLQWTLAAQNPFSHPEAEGLLIVKRLTVRRPSVSNKVLGSMSTQGSKFATDPSRSAVTHLQGSSRLRIADPSSSGGRSAVQPVENLKQTQSAGRLQSRH